MGGDTGPKVVVPGAIDAVRARPGELKLLLAGSLPTIGRLHGVSRPAISTLWPNKRSGAVVLDVGANHECTPKNLIQFAIMGSVFAEVHIGVDKPRVGLLNIGEEKSKGNDLCLLYTSPSPRDS